MFFFGLTILLLYCDLVFSENACVSETPCECILSNNTAIDLSSVGSPDFIRFHDIAFPTNCSKTYLYSYNPCFPFNSPDKQVVTEKGHTPCSGASACVKSSGGTEGQFPEMHAIGLQNSSRFCVINSSYYINYTVPGSSKTLLVKLICNESYTESKLNMLVPECSNNNKIMLSLTSKCACPGGCPSSFPPTPHTGLSTGSKLLIAFFTILLAYLIVGILWNFCNGSKGIEIIPNFEFWNDLPTLIMEGIAFSCSCCINKRSYGEV